VVGSIQSVGVVVVGLQPELLGDVAGGVIGSVGQFNNLVVAAREGRCALARDCG
jgi:hypothetical protein